MTIPNARSGDRADTYEPVDPVRPVAGYLGGKRVLAKRLVAMINAIPHSVYAEPFIGMGGVFFRRDRRPKAEVINDISRDVVTLFRILQRHYPQFLDTLKWQLSSRAEHQRLVATDPDTLTDLERAARFLYLQRTSYSGRLTNRSYSVVTTQASKFDLTKVVPLLEDVHERLARVVIERLPYAELIDRYDTEGTLFYLDPPYWGCEHYYGKGVFSPADFDRLSGLLEGIKGRFIMSLNDTPGVRETFARFELEPVTFTYNTGPRSTKAQELIISGGG